MSYYLRFPHYIQKFTGGLEVLEFLQTTKIPVADEDHRVLVDSTEALDGLNEFLLRVLLHLEMNFSARDPMCVKNVFGSLRVGVQRPSEERDLPLMKDGVQMAHLVILPALAVMVPVKLFQYLAIFALLAHVRPCSHCCYPQSNL